MLAAMVSSRTYPGRRLPIVADDMDNLIALGQAVKDDVPGVVEKIIKEMGSRRSSKTGARALYLELLPGIRAVMLEEGIEPSKMADKLIESAPLVHPELAEELQADNQVESLVGELLGSTSPRERLIVRLSTPANKDDARLMAMGRMLAKFILTGQQLEDFTALH